MARDARELRGAWATFQQHRYAEPAPDLAPYVSHYWGVEWDLRGQQPYRQKVVPYPNVHLTFRDGVATVRGPERGHVVRVLAERGEVFGVAFRPGGFRPFLGRAVSTITGRSVPAAAIFGPDVSRAVTRFGPDLSRAVTSLGPDVSRAVTSPGPDSSRAVTRLGPDWSRAVTSLGPALPREVTSEVEEFLRARLPAPDPQAQQAAAIVARIQAEPQLKRVDLLARQAGLGVRRLQRLFAEYVGLGPKWVIRRYRLHEVGERLAAGVAIDWAGLAADLGYADQAHFVRDFTAMIGESPTHYAQRYPQVPDKPRTDPS